MGHPNPFRPASDKKKKYSKLSKQREPLHTVLYTISTYYWPDMMVCYKEIFCKSSLETLSKRAGTFKKYLAGYWANNLSITVYQVLTSSNQINNGRVLPPEGPVGESNLWQSRQGKSKKIFSIKKSISWALISSVGRVGIPCRLCSHK